MSQHDLDVTTSDANTGITFRAAVNAALQALGSCQQGGTAPTTTYPSMLWADTTAGLLKMRNMANTAWITIGTLDAANLGLLSLAGGTLTGLLTLSGAGTVALHAATVGQVQAGAFSYAVDTGAADALVAAFTPAITALTPGMIVLVKTIAANTTTTPTLNVNGLGAVTITRNSGALLAGDIKANGYSLFQYYTTGWNLLNPILTGANDLAALAVTTAALAAGAVTTAKLAAGAVDSAALAAGAVTSAKASGLLGTWDATKVANTNYLAATDLFVSAYATAVGADGTLKILTDATSTPTVVRAYEGDAVETGKTHGVSCFVKKGDYWNVASSSGTVTIHIIPIGA